LVARQRLESTPFAEPIKCERPWSHLADFEKNHVWADYVAWKLWMSMDGRDPSSAMTTTGATHSLYESITGSLDEVQCAYLYATMCQLADGVSA
jgi:hypothetical protein